MLWKENTIKMTENESHCTAYH